MKVKVQYKNTISAFLNVRDEWLLSEDNSIIVIREIQYTHTKPEPEDEEVLPPNTRMFKRKKKTVKPQDEWHITKLVAEGYNSDGRYIGTYTDEWCIITIKLQDDNYCNFNLYDLRKRWENIVEQKDAMLEHEAKMNAEAKKSKAEAQEICNCDKRDMPTYEEDNKTWCPQCGLEVK